MRVCSQLILMQVNNWVCFKRSLNESSPGDWKTDYSHCAPCGKRQLLGYPHFSGISNHTISWENFIPNYVFSTYYVWKQWAIFIRQQSIRPKCEVFSLCCPSEHKHKVLMWTVSLKRNQYYGFKKEKIRTTLGSFVRVCSWQLFVLCSSLPVTIILSLMYPHPLGYIFKNNFYLYSKTSYLYQSISLPVLTYKVLLHRQNDPCFLSCFIITFCNYFVFHLSSQIGTFNSRFHPQFYPGNGKSLVWEIF